MIHVSAQHKVLGVPATPAILSLFPQARKVTYAGNSLALVPHSFLETKLLRGLGLDVPAPCLTQYAFPHPPGQPPFDVQRKTVGMMTTNQRAYNLNGMGTGKTRCTLWSYDFLRSIGQANKLLVAAPLSTLNFTWAREVMHAFPHLSCTVLTGDKERRLKRLRENHDVYIINHDGLAVIHDELMKRKDIDTFAIDEIAVFRNSRSSRNKVVRELAHRMVWAWGLTGSPTPQDPTDAYGQCLILTPNTVPKRFSHFRDAVMTKVTAFKYAAKHDAKTTVFNVMQPAVRYTLDDVIELPDFVERTVDIDLGSKQEKIYTALKNEAYAQVQSHEITAANAGAVLNKLLQVSLGYVYAKRGGQEREVVALDNDNRLERLVDDINACEQKVIVFVPFTHALHGIAERLRKEGVDTGIVYGDVPDKERDKIFAAFQNTGKYRVLLAHPTCMAHGLTLTAASTIIWFGPIASLEIFEQANARIRRIGQKHKQLFLMYQATPAEKKMYAALRAKRKVQDGVLDMFANAQL